MRAISLFLLTVFLPLLALAQLVPLTLDQTITLPQAGAIWDVMPHPDGYYVWAELSDSSGFMRIEAGSTLGPGFAPFDVSGYRSSHAALFWNIDHEPCVVAAGIPSSYAGLALMVYRLTDHALLGGPLPFYEYYRGYPGGGGDWTDYTGVSVFSPVPFPPLPSVRVSLFVRYLFHSYHVDYPYTTSRDGQVAIFVPDVLNYDSCAACSLWAANFSCSVLHGDSSEFALAGTGQWHSSSHYGYVDTWSTAVTHVRGTADGLTNPVSRLLNSNVEDTAMIPSGITATFLSSQQRVVSLTRFPEFLRAFNSASPQSWAWSVYDNGAHAISFAAEVVPADSAEEFLCYDHTRHVFDVLGAADGHNYGVTDTITLGSEPRIIGRYDSTSRRLAFRVGNQLKLYRFGEYLAAGDRDFIPHPSAFSLSCFPNPFNPTTQIAFTLPRPQRVRLVVYDVTGRQVCALTDRVYESGEHRVSFYGSNLPSGIYFARLSAGTVSRTEKLLLLK